ncbi:alkaline phosphatase family protein [Haloferax marisrubri]|uniref:Sulfatase N-terminal domain-containing protein n=1 Tax=Haloferax marisrubri TaxID=1544719 RepID=A0A2P4NP51_9EURY|nr:hypothetical protein [Haloferax marisrubri]POG54943.1 hypothetical protein AUR65_014575 [Haloferax marisrubri]
MTLTDWLNESKFKVREYGLVDGITSSAYDFWSGALRRGFHRAGADQLGTSIYDRDWDALVVLDTARVDAMEAVADEYDFLPSHVPPETSLGSTSWEWLHRNFTPERSAELAETAYVTANAHTRRFGDEFQVGPDAFGLLDEVWEYAWDEGFGGMPPESVTDRAISVGRETDYDRLIVHYMQPHTPYRTLDVSNVDSREQGEMTRSEWDLLQTGQLDRDVAWEAYLDNLRWGLDEVETLLENLDADTVVLTADHGEAFGEWGIYGHIRHVPLPELRQVPWVKLSASDDETYEPSLEHAETQVSDDAVEERLRALGYK